MVSLLRHVRKVAKGDITSITRANSHHEMEVVRRGLSGRLGR
jgi:hypothetical protein